MKTHSTRRVLISLATMAVLAACKGGGDADDAGAGKAAHEAAIEQLKQPVAIVAAYKGYLVPPDVSQDKYAPKRRPDAEKISICAANEIRHAANAARQNLQRTNAAMSKELDDALQAVANVCTDAVDPEALAKCTAAIQAFDDALGKGAAAASAAGATAKFPRVAPDAVTEEAKKSIAPFLKARGPSAAEKAYIAKRADANVTALDLMTACQSAAEEAGAVAKAYDQADEPVRLIAVTHKMSLDSQCGALNATETLRKDVDDCRKKAKTPECKIVCGKAKAIVENGVPAATFAPLEKDVADVCKE
jgi:hypothetical protein